jgi:phospholipase/carboxylesterase
VSLLGFSDGATTAGDLLLAEPGRFRAAALLGGALPWGTGPPATQGRLRGRDVLLSYGELDAVIPRDLLERTGRYLLEESGARAEVVVEPALAHLVSTAQVQQVRTLVERAVRT